MEPAADADEGELTNRAGSPREPRAVDLRVSSHTQTYTIVYVSLTDCTQSNSLDAKPLTPILPLTPPMPPP